MPQRLLTILHVSDLHIGVLDPATGNAQLDHISVQLFSNFTCFDGVLGHHARALDDLNAFHWQLMREGEDPLVILSGDVSRIGHADSFRAADDFLSREVELGVNSDNFVGLMYPKWRDYAIPGNHDHWVGRPSIWGGPDPAFYHWFPMASLPRAVTVPLANGREIEFLLVDTDADVSPRDAQRLRAVGSFQSQLAAARLRRKQPHQIRVLLMHHSWEKRGWILSIDRGTRGALAPFLRRHGIQLILTGHTHEPLLNPFVPGEDGGPPLLECRCGTTTQLDEVPDDWRTVFGTFPHRRWPKNSLLVHRIIEDGGQTRWLVETFTRLPGSGFVSAGHSGQRDMPV